MLKNLNIYLRLDSGNIYILFIIYQFHKILIHFSQVKSVCVCVYINLNIYLRLNSGNIYILFIIYQF
jgi:predicted phosphoadenosine phosphosulfate sulfurtransferase